MDLAKYIRDIPDFPKPGILFKDITPLLNDPAAFQEAIDRFLAHHHLDAERGLVYVPLGTPSNDFFGGRRLM